MKIEKIIIKPYEKSICPGISFEVQISYKRYEEAIIGLNGWLEAYDGKIIAEVKEVAEAKSAVNIAARRSSFDSHFKEKILKATVVSFLEKRALEHIEERRKENRKGYVKLTLHLKVKYVRNMAVVSPSYLVRPGVIELPEISVQTSSGEERGEIVIYAPDSEFTTDYANRWLLSGDGSPIFLSIEEEILNGDIEIPSSDWIHDYAPKLGLGEYFIIEIQKGRKTIKEAWNYIEKADDSFREWNNKGVCNNCREAGKVLDKAIKEKFGRDSFTYNERWGRAYLRFFNYLVSLEIHLEDMVGKNWEELIKNLPEGFPHPKKFGSYSREEIMKLGKTDAEHILIVTKALIKYAEELLQLDG